MARRALLIANGSFQHSGNTKLHSPVSDARRLAELLRRDDVGGFDVEVAEDLTSAELRKRVLRFFRSAGIDDQSIFYFSGHGDKNAAGRLYFKTHETEPDALDATALPARYVIEQAKQSLSKQILFFVDCCYSGSFVDSLGEKKGDQILTVDDFPVEGSRGMAAITASASLQPAKEADVAGRIESLFTRHMIEGIATGAADPQSTGKITLANLLNHICEGLRTSGATQQPRHQFSNLNGSEPVALNPAKPANPLPPEWLAQCQHERWQERQLAATELAGLAQQDAVARPFAVDELRKLAKDPDDRVKLFAQRYLQALGEEIEEPKPDAPYPPRRYVAQPFEKPKKPGRKDNALPIANAILIVVAVLFSIALWGIFAALTEPRPIYSAYDATADAGYAADPAAAAEAMSSDNAAGEAPNVRFVPSPEGISRSSAPPPKALTAAQEAMKK